MADVMWTVAGAVDFATQLQALFRRSRNMKGGPPYYVLWLR